MEIDLKKYWDLLKGGWDDMDNHRLELEAKRIRLKNYAYRYGRSAGELNREYVIERLQKRRKWLIATIVPIVFGFLALSVKILVTLYS
ncbi:MAG: hypothetical protein G01um101430_614 [Parcubacteria group bacterium Gr01-1014_30]|nr:MAG: hypothetical protein G01um101430_614 [Parcubacteria group bacterium Gr01-1014_30]